MDHENAVGLLAARRGVRPSLEGAPTISLVLSQLQQTLERCIARYLALRGANGRVCRPSVQRSEGADSRRAIASGLVQLHGEGRWSAWAQRSDEWSVPLARPGDRLRGG